MYFAQGDYSKALEYFEEVLKIRLSVYGENHSRVASVYNDIGEIYSVQGDDFKVFWNYFKKSLKIVCQFMVKIILKYLLFMII